ncbi:CDGSH iron-sulfur domain-containing protein [Thermomonas sp. HDW16]|uniref:CDGSH iron-sulfur domain-containing protein n=1 Tax=Thermomonas sp. HDW16 TaxID=2714945 RepID=UPI00140AACD4|nr:CDGSH iron-sulfur domain-containing protein [Thermomonas sp. HDW16]QIL21609.1 CDGSH iron-sulfur domain-containing protein [Thermomonas sp. HDW16]
MSGTRDNVQIGTTQSDPDIWIDVTADGPYVVHGAPPLHTQTIVQNASGNSGSYRQGQAFAVKDGSMLCRCGHSRHKPYCDGSHKTAAVDLAETASFAPLLQGSEEIDGPQVALTDNEDYCAFARFCDNGQRIWNEVQIPGKEHAELAVEMAHHCPGGRLLVWDAQTKQPIEPAVPVALGLIEDPAEGCSGPLTLQGGVRVQSASGRSYEIRNRQALCRCGASSNKPFCDGSHASIKFQDGL